MYFLSSHTLVQANFYHLTLQMNPTSIILCFKATTPQLPRLQFNDISIIAHFAVLNPPLNHLPHNSNQTSNNSLENYARSGSKQQHTSYYRTNKKTSQSQYYFLRQHKTTIAQYISRLCPTTKLTKLFGNTT